MKRFSIIVLALFFGSYFFAQKYKLIANYHCPDYSKDCRIIGNCISSKYLKNDTLHFTIYIDNEGRDLYAYRNSFTFRNDTLSLDLNDTNRISISKVYNKYKHKTEIIETRKVSGYNLVGGPDFQRIQYTFTGFDKLPGIIRFCDLTLHDCPTKPVRFEICDNDTINMINANGLKQGNWIEFYDTGEIMKKKKYNNGQFIEGYIYNKQRVKMYKLEESEVETATSIELK